MRKIEFNELQKIELEILVFFDHFCRENNLKYCLYGGTLLGAIRHNGFIPWDDDIDVAMPRQDYDKLCKIFPGKSERYQLKNSELVEDYHIVFSKIVDSKTTILSKERKFYTGAGVYIDIFPLDGFGNNWNSAYSAWTRMKNYEKLLRPHMYNEFKFYSIGEKSMFLKKFLWFTMRNKYVAKILQFFYFKKCLRFDYERSLFIGSYSATARPEQEIFEKKVFEENIDWRFEGHFFPVPKAYHEYLSKKYKNYMEFPPEEKRVPAHDFEAFWI